MARLTKPLKDWFPVPDDKDGAGLLVRHLKDGEVESINSESLKFSANSDGDEIVTEADLRWNKRQELVVLASIVDWKGFFDTKGKPIPCTKANKLKALYEFGWLEPFVAHCRTKLKAKAAEKKEAVTKNS